MNSFLYSIAIFASQTCVESEGAIYDVPEHHRPNQTCGPACIVGEYKSLNVSDAD